jgi:leucyl-tRNA synthetase
MTWLNFLSEKQVSEEEYDTLLRLLAPFVPHIAEELYHLRNKSANSIHLEEWPIYQPKYLIEDTLHIVVQINGKLRDTISIQNLSFLDAKNKDQNLIEKEARRSEKVTKHLEGKTIKKVIYVKGKLINFVV